jgi:hypothetical protein
VPLLAQCPPADGFEHGATLFGGLNRHEWICASLAFHSEREARV